MKRDHYIYLFNLFLAAAIITTLCNTKQSATDTAKQETPDETQEMQEEDQRYICDIDKYRTWKDMNTIPPHEMGKLLFLKNDDVVIPFYQAGLAHPSYSDVKNGRFCYLHFFEKGILYCIIHNPLPASISYDDKELLFFRSKLVHFSEWDNFKEAIPFVKQVAATHFLLLSADPDMPFTTIWEPLKNILSIFPLNRRDSLYSWYIPVCSNADSSENKCSFADISPHHNMFFEQMIMKAKNSTLTRDDAEILQRKMNENKYEIIACFLNKGGYFYDAVFTPKNAHIRLCPENIKE